MGHVHEAEEIISAAVDRARRQEHRVALADILRVQGMTLARGARSEESDRAFESAVSLAHDMSYPYAEAQALHRWATALHGRGDVSGAKERLQKAHAIFRELGATRDLQETDDLLRLLEES